MIDVVIDNRLRMHSDDLPEEFAKSLMATFTHRNPAHAKLVAMGKPYNAEPEEYVMWRHGGPDDEEFSIPRGGLHKLRDAFDEYDLDYQVVDRRSEGYPHITGSFVDPWQLGMDLFPEHKLVPWDHQTEMTASAMQFQQILIKAPTGSGKTSAILKMIAEAQMPALVVMWDAGLLEDTWQPRIEQELGILAKDQGIIRGSKFKLKPITLAMQQTLARWDEDKWARLQHEGRSIFGAVYCDEVQRYSARTFVDFIDRFDCKMRVGVSADPKRKDGKTFIIYDMFGPVRHEVKKSTLVKKRIIHEVECYVVPTNFRADWYVKKVEDKIIDHFVDRKVLLLEMQNDDERNELALRLTEECVRAGLPSLVFAQYVDHARKLDHALTKRGIASGLALGGKEWESTFKETLQQLRNGQLQVGCGTFGKLGVGHDIPTVAAGIAVTPVHQNKGFLGQVKGRISRTTAGKQNARILVLWDQHVFGIDPLLNLRAWNEVCNMWDEAEARWRPIAEYLKERKHDDGFRRLTSGQATSAGDIDDIFQTVNRRSNR